MIYVLKTCQEKKKILTELCLESLTIAGVTIPKQQIALATSGFWNGDGISTGILGLGMPGLTEAFVSTDPKNDSAINAISYNPVVTTMNTASKLPAIFSLGLSRDPADSFLALGGVPSDVKVGEWASTPLLQVSLRRQVTYISGPFVNLG